MDISQGKNVYLIGIKGAGMAGLAQILKSLGYKVSGSDIADTFFTDAVLRRAGIEFHDGFNASNIPQRVDWAVSSGAYLSERQKAKGKRQKYNLKLKTKYERSESAAQSRVFGGAEAGYNPEIAELQRRGVPIMSLSLIHI